MQDISMTFMTDSSYGQGVAWGPQDFVAFASAAVLHLSISCITCSRLAPCQISPGGIAGRNGDVASFAHVVKLSRVVTGT